MLLTIGMIVKNEEKYLRDCLEGMRPILEHVESELIIIDTGSIDTTVDIAREYTDKVFEVEWRNDFAWARNQVLEHAKGRWLLSIDGDEIFKDCDDLIEFFNSGEYQKNNFASIVMKNLSANGSVANFVELPRLYKLSKGTKWVGRIHEFIHADFPGKNLKSYCLHYGYAFESDAAKRAKHERNISPLLKEYKEQPNNPRNIVHLINEYKLVRKFDEWRKYINIGLDLMKKIKDNPYYRTFATELIYYHSQQEEYAELIDAANKHFKASKVACVSDITNLASKLRAEMHLERYLDAAQSGIDLYKRLDEHEKGNLNTYVQLISAQPTDDMITKSRSIASISIAFAAGGEYAQAMKWITNAGAEKYAGFFDSLIPKIIKPEQQEKIGGLYEYIFNNYGSDSIEYENMVMSLERQLPSEATKKAIAKMLLSQSISIGTDDYMRLQELRTTGEGLDYFLSADKAFPQYFSDVVIAALRVNADFSAFLARLDITSSREFVGNIMRTNKDFEELALSSSRKWLEDALPLKSVRLLSILIATVYASLEAKADEDIEESKIDDKKLQMFEMSSRMRHKYLKMAYRDGVYCEEHIADLSEDDRFTFYVGHAYDSKDAGDTAEFARGLRLALRLRPSMKKMISKIGESLQQNMQQSNAVSKEIAELRAAVKGMIVNFINMGDFASAAAALEIYAADNANDPDVEKLRATISAKL